ncbi:MAG: CinA family protein [Candidatus Limiplasma sp.]|nr:CinA family protein [Candidatus Limiplasma sp.]
MSALYALAEQVVRAAVARGVTLGTAESLTAGMIASALAEVPGASNTLVGGIVSYAPRVKQALLGISQSVIQTDGVVSEPCARQMAEGARRALAVDIAVSATGLAGPNGDGTDTPVGTVFIGCASAGGTQVQQYVWTGDRQAVREQAASAALTLVLNVLQA